MQNAVVTVDSREAASKEAGDIILSKVKLATVKPPIKDTPREDKPPNKGQTKSTLVYTL